MLDVVAAIMVNENEEIFIAKRSGADKLAKRWEFPGGKVDEG